MKKRRVLKKELEKMLIFINCLIFCFICCIDDIKDIKSTIIILIILFSILFINSIIINKYGRLLKD